MTKLTHRHLMRILEWAKDDKESFEAKEDTPYKLPGKIYPEGLGFDVDTSGIKPSQPQRSYPEPYYIDCDIVEIIESILNSREYTLMEDHVK